MFSEFKNLLELLLLLIYLISQFNCILKILAMYVVISYKNKSRKNWKVNTSTCKCFEYRLWYVCLISLKLKITFGIICLKTLLSTLRKKRKLHLPGHGKREFIRCHCQITLQLTDIWQPLPFLNIANKSMFKY